MAKINFCPKCGGSDLKQYGAQYSCGSCKHTFGDVSGTSPAVGYAGAMLGNTPPPQGGNGFAAPPSSLLDSIRANAERQRQLENAARAESSNRRNGSGNVQGGSGGGNSGNGRANNVSSSGGGNGGSGASGGGSGSTGSGSSGSTGVSGSGSDSENKLRFLDNVNLMNDFSYQLVNGNANTWANIARDKGIINSKQHTEIKYMVATRNCIAHGSGDSVRITAELVTNAKNYYELMRRTSSQIN